jgi:site-specific recombinase XerD
VKCNSKNEKLKRRFCRWLKEAEGLSDATIDGIRKAIYLYEDFTDHEDFSSYSQTKGIGMKRWLEKKTHRGKPMSIRTIYGHLRHLRRFFTWLACQPGYKSKIDLTSVSYLSLDKKKVREATSRRPVKFPSLEYVKSLVASIEVKTELDQRDRALIAFLLLSGARDGAVASLPLRAFDQSSMRIHQDPELGVNTKFGKRIESVLLPFDDQLVKCVLDWARYLVEVKLFGQSDPLFPRSKVEQAEGGFSFVCTQVEPVFWAGASAIRGIMIKRAKAAGLEYYHPHTFRHAAIHLATRHRRSAQEIKALSQNFGHENVDTTLSSYGTLDQHAVTDIVEQIDFSDDRPTNKGSVPIDAIMRLLDDHTEKP